MYPFEIQGSDGKIHRYYNKFNEYTKKLEAAYPANFVHPRAEIEIIYPKWKLRDCPIHRGNHEIKKKEKDWSVIFEAFPAHNHASPEGSWILFVEKGHQRPTYGEEVELYSTGLTLLDNNANRFCYFRGQFWLVNAFYGGQPGSAQPPKAVQIPKYRSLDDD